MNGISIQKMLRNLDLIFKNCDFRRGDLMTWGIFLWGLNKIWKLGISIDDFSKEWHLYSTLYIQFGCDLPTRGQFYGIKYVKPMDIQHELSNYNGYKIKPHCFGFLLWYLQRTVWSLGKNISGHAACTRTLKTAIKWWLISQWIGSRKNNGWWSDNHGDMSKGI